MEIETFFFDTYAFFEIIAGNPRYQRFATGIALITTKLNLMELYYGLLLKQGEEVAEKYFNMFVAFAVDFDDAIIKEAMKFRVFHKEKGLSYADCIGYAIAQRRGVKFLTGDMQFEHLGGVEFVK